MKVLYVVSQSNFSTLGASGFSTHMREFLASLEKEHEVERLVAGDLDPIVPPGKARTAARAFTPRWARNLRRDLKELSLDRKMKRLIRSKAASFAPDVIYERLTPLHAAGAAAESGAPYFVELNSPLSEESGVLSSTALPSVIEKRENECLSRAAGVIAVSTPLKEYLSRKGVPEEKVLVSPNGVNPSLFDPTKFDGSRHRRELGWDEKLVVGYVGSFQPWHGIDILIEAADRLGEPCPDLRFLIVGGGLREKELRALIERRRLGGKIRVTGLVPHRDVPSWTAAMDIGVMPRTNWYGSPIKLLEYGAMGKAIVAPDTATVRDVMEPETDGILIPESTPEFLAGALRSLAEKREERLAMGERFRRKVLGGHTWDLVVGRIVEFIRARLDGGR